jgi:hypothetical protein
MRYKVIGANRLYIDKRFYEVGDEFATVDPLPNEDSLVAAGNVLVLPEPKAEPKLGKPKSDD